MYIRTRNAPYEVDSYLAKLPPEQRDPLQAIREILLTLLPGCKQQVSMGVAIFSLGDKKVVALSANRDEQCIFHCMEVRFGPEMRERLKGVDHNSTNFYFSKQRPLPEDLLRELVDARMNHLQKPSIKGDGYLGSE